MKRILIVSPVFNEQEVLPKFLDAIEKLRNEKTGTTEIHLLLVNDGSTDKTLIKMQEFESKNPEWFFYLSFTSNFGYQAAQIAGLINAGTWPDAIITMDSDLEHPVSLIPALIQVWQNEKAMVVNAIRREAFALSFKKRFLSKLFYKLTRSLTKLDIQPGQADFRLWDASLVRSIQSYLPNSGSLRVFAAWLPVKKAVVKYDQNVQTNRISRFTFKKNLEMAMISIIRFSNFPLIGISIMGAIGLIFTFMYALFIGAKYLMGNIYPGWTSLILTVSFMGCLQLVSLGILASYLRRLVFSKDLPLFILDESKKTPQ